MRVIATRRGQLADGRIIAPGETFDCPDESLALVTDDNGPITGWMRLDDAFRRDETDPTEHERAESARRERSAAQANQRQAALANASRTEPPLRAAAYRAPRSIHDGALPDGTR